MYTLNGTKKIMMNIKNNILSGVKTEISKAPDKVIVNGMSELEKLCLLNKALLNIATIWKST